KKKKCIQELNQWMKQLNPVTDSHLLKNVKRIVGLIRCLKIKKSIENHGLEQTVELLKTMKAQDPFTDDELNNIARNCLKGGQLSETAVANFLLNGLDDVLVDLQQFIRLPNEKEYNSKCILKCKSLEELLELLLEDKIEIVHKKKCLDKLYEWLLLLNDKSDT